MTRSTLAVFDDNEVELASRVSILTTDVNSENDEPDLLTDFIYSPSAFFTQSSTRRILPATFEKSQLESKAGT